MVKLIDFGFSVVIAGGQRLKIFCGTPSYMSPEIVRKHEYDGKPVDIWALGVLLYVMLTGTFPFRGVSEQDLYSKIQKGFYKQNHEALSRDARHTIRRMLEVDWRKRITAQELLREPFVACHDVRLTAFEQAGGICRSSSQDVSRRAIGTPNNVFNRNNIKDAHVAAVNHLVSHLAFKI